MAGSDDGYDLTEIFVVKFVLADVVIIAALLFAGPLYAVAITALLVVSVFLVWYLTQRVGSPAEDRAEVDPVTTLQNRYAAGELTEAEFEAKLEQLLDANDRATAAGVETADLSLERST
ncbi:SHOCT domain-containing protein [Natrononativus amylolyticus]|uniref:SHOCT domain-containing protein n=1 Tax=Natrononativus amylolyticus TaxID=2963434 RepID=UPI0020CC2382|nr:SHOCT domain-containing protein [Natrononativus amylolyticus]